MNFEQLKIFLAVVEHRSFTKAAETMYISHSTTSRNVTALESSLGVRLLVRDNRSVSLTPAGEILYSEGEKLIRKIESIEGLVKNAGLGLTGKLTVATVSLYSSDLFDGYKDFCKKYPDVVLGMYHREIPDIWNLVYLGEVDVGVSFSYSLPEEIEGFETRVVASERFCIVAPLDHPLSQRKSVKMEDIRNTSYISLSTANFDFIKKLDEQSNFAGKDNSVSIVPTIESLFLQVRSGNGLSLVPYPVAYEYGANCAILDVEDMDSSFDVVIVWKKDNLNPSLPLFVDTVMEHITEVTRD